MVKEVAISVNVPGVNVQEFHDIVLDTKSTILEYHRQEGDPNASVSAWQDNQRVIIFSVPLTGVPDLVKTAIGTSRLLIRETQTRSWSADGVLMVTSRPMLDIVGGSKFITDAEFVVRPDEGGCKVFAKVVCAAAGPWGLIGTIENIMAEQAAESVRDFLHFCVQRCMTHDGDQAVDAQPDLIGYASDLESSYELFQDALETASSQAYSDTPHHVVRAPGVDAEQLEHLLEVLQKQACGIESTISSLQAALLSAKLPSARSGTVRGSAASTPVVYFWAPLLVAFAVGACFGVMSTRNSAISWRR